MRRLLDHVTGAPDLATPQALLATTFDLNPEFVDLDFLPSVLGLSGWHDYSAKGRIELEQMLAHLDAAALLMDGRRYQGRPRNLRVHLAPAVSHHGSRLHAKVTLVVHEHAVRLLVGSANLTMDGYRHNREVYLPIVATPKRPEEARFIADAIEPMRKVLSAYWNEHADRTVEAALEKLRSWQGAPSNDDFFLWSGSDCRALHEQFLELWPLGERIDRIAIVSPFWCEERTGGPLSSFLQAMCERSGTRKPLNLKLITEAERDPEVKYRPVLPASLAGYDFSAMQVKAVAAAALPEVDPEDVGRGDILRARRLHAKVVLVEGPKTSLAYLGSANFTYSGWGFGAPIAANIEAGAVLRRRGKGRAALSALLPETSVEVALGPGNSGVVHRTAVEEEAEKPFPRFLRDIELRANRADPSLLELVVTIQAGAAACEYWLELRLAEEAQGGSRLATGVPLEPETIRSLLRHRAVIVHWSERSQGEGACVTCEAEFPVNVSLEVRDSLPFGDPSQMPREGELVAFYQGRIELAALFPDPTDLPPNAVGSEVGKSSVDTSQILSYQIREFVEALPGIRQELERTVTPSSIKLAFLGAVSPLALGREIAQSALRGRSKTAVAFQLIELDACISRAKPNDDLTPQVRQAWENARAKALAEIRRLRGELRQGTVDPFEDPAFVRYAATMLGPTGAES